MPKQAHIQGVLILLFLAVFSTSCDVKMCCAPPIKKYPLAQPTGYSAHDFLSGNTFTQLVVEVDYMTGYKPDEQALDKLKDFLSQRLHKSQITILEPTAIQGQDRATYTPAEIRNSEIEFRDTFTKEPTLSAYLLFVDGKYEQENVLGIAYYNTSTAFFGAAFDQASGGLTQVSRYQIEATTFLHEFGHLFGSVNIAGSGTEMQTPHEANNNHCDNKSCLMYYAVESTELFGSVFGGSIPQLDQNCIHDLQANGGK